MATGLQRRIEAAGTTLTNTGSVRKALGSFIYPSSMSWNGRGYGSMLSIAPRNHAWRNIDPVDNSAVMNCLAWIFRNFGQGVLQTYREARDGSLKTVDVPGFLELIYKPNDFHTAMNFWGGTLLSYFTDGNAYWLKVRDARGFGVPTGLWYEPHWAIKPHWPEDGSQFIDYYERRINGAIQKIPVENVVHFKLGINPGNTRYGMAPLRVALLEVFTDQEAAAYTAALLKNMAIPGVIVAPNTPVGFTLEKMEQMSQRWQQKFAGDNRGMPLFLDYESTVTSLGFSPTDMDLTELRRIGEERISGCFGLPAIVAGLGAGLEASTYNNLKELKKSAFEDCLSPAWDDIAETLTNQLLVDFTEDEDICADFDKTHIAALKEDEDKKNARTMERLTRGAITVNEARLEWGLKPDPAANYYLLPNNVRPVTAAVAMARAGQEIEDPQSQPGLIERDEGGGKWLPPPPQPLTIIVRAEPETLLLTDGSKKKAYEWGGLMLRRKPTALEQIIDIKAIDAAMGLGARTLRGLLLTIRNTFIQDAIAELADLTADEYHELIVETTEEQQASVEDLLSGSFLRGAELIVEELVRQGASLLSVLTREPDTETLRSLSGVTVSRLANDVQARVIAAGQQGALLGVENVPAYAQAQMDAGSTGYVDRAARSATNTSLAAGRKTEMGARPDDDIAYFVYSAVLDANTCEPCGEADGLTADQEKDLPSVPNPRCPGGGECRCVHIPVSPLTEVGAVVPPLSGSGAEARAEFEEIRTEVEAETQIRLERRRGLIDRFISSTGQEKARIEQEIINLDRQEQAAQLNALERYRAALYQEIAANFTIKRDASVDSRLDRNIGQGSEAFARFIGTGKIDGSTATLFGIPGRSYASGDYIYLNLKEEPAVVAHELGHFLETFNKSIRDEIKAFYARRTAGDVAEKLNDLVPGNGYEDDGFTKKDKFAISYIGKQYLNKRGDVIATEILAIALQYFYERPLEFALEDPEYFDFIYELLRK